MHPMESGASRGRPTRGNSKGPGGGGCPRGGSGLVLGSGFLPWPCFGEEHLFPTLRGTTSRLSAGTPAVP